MAQHRIIPFHPVDSSDAADYSFRNWNVGAGETFIRGAVLVDGGNREIDEAGANPAAIIGVALADANAYAWIDGTYGDAQNHAPFALADQEFRGTLTTGTTPTVTADVSAVVGTTFGITKQSGSNIWIVDSAKNAANQRVLITGVEGADGDSDVPVRFVFLAANQVVVQ